jgi:hypothetical protein
MGLGKDVDFPNIENWDGTRMVVSFAAESNGRQIDCAVSMEALQDHFGGDHLTPLEAFRAHRWEIERIAEYLIVRKRFEPDGSVLVRTQNC